MAARKATKREAEVPAADVTEDVSLEEDGDLLADEDDLEDAFDDEDEDLEDGLDEDEAVLEETTLEEADLDGEGEGEDVVVAAPLPPEAEFDDDEDDIVAAVAGDDDADDDATEVDGLRDGEFVCRSCFMAKRDTQLADPDRLLCRDCA